MGQAYQALRITKERVSGGSIGVAPRGKPNKKVGFEGSGFYAVKDDGVG